MEDTGIKYPYSLDIDMRGQLWVDCDEDEGSDAYTSSHSQNASKLLTEKFPKYSKPRSFRGPLTGLCPGPAGDLKRSPDPSSTHAPTNHKSGNPGSPQIRIFIEPINTRFLHVFM
jgi:hypothetical protein